MKFVNFLKSRLIFSIFYCFWMFVNKRCRYLMCGYLKKWKCFNVKSSVYYFHKKAKILADFQICISVPLNERMNACLNSVFFLLNPDQMHNQYGGLISYCINEINNHCSYVTAIYKVVLFKGIFKRRTRKSDILKFKGL